MKRDDLQSPLDLWKHIGGETKQTASNHQTFEDSLLAVYKDHLTYTFVFGREVASIHFDRSKKEIFFRGQNIRNLSLEDPMVKALWHFKEVLKADSRGRPFLSDYDATLGERLAENYKGRV